MIAWSIVLIIAALVFYSVGVWSERLSGILKPWHAVMFWLGFAFDAVGTELMRRLTPGFELTLHNITGATALFLMLAHAGWATQVLVSRNERAIHTFHRISVVVWTLWLIPFVSGLVLGATAST
jgi:uncharacterized repeat protein (TIGR03987 family)